MFVVRPLVLVRQRDKNTRETMSRQRGRRSIIEPEEIIEDIYRTTLDEPRSMTHSNHDKTREMMAAKEAARRRQRATQPGVTRYQPPAPPPAGGGDMGYSDHNSYSDFSLDEMTEEEQIREAMRMSLADQQMPTSHFQEVRQTVLAADDHSYSSSSRDFDQQHSHFLPSVGAEPIQAPSRRPLNGTFRGPTGSPKPPLHNNMGSSRSVASHGSVGRGLSPVRTSFHNGNMGTSQGSLSSSPPRGGNTPMNRHQNGGMIPMASSRSVDIPSNMNPRQTYGRQNESVRSIEEPLHGSHGHQRIQHHQQPQEQYPMTNQSYRNFHQGDHYSVGSKKDIGGAISVDAGSVVPETRVLSIARSPELYKDQLDDLHNLGFPPGLALEMGQVKSVYPVRFWVLDNSGSMMSNDGNMTRNNMSVQCTRWAELEQTVEYHANLSGLLQAPTIFRMLNDPGARCGPQEFSVAQHGNNMRQEVEFIRQLMRKCQPHGSTPLSAHLHAIGERIAMEEKEMRRKGLEAVVVLATDGLPTSPEGDTSEAINNEFVQALQYLQSLPVWVVVRLCTDDPAVVKFYNELDSILELPLEVLDDFKAEAKEINQYNKWLNYAMPLHRCRELGYHQRIFDLLDERALNKDEIKEFATLLFGEDAMMKAPDVHTHWNDFTKFLNKVSKDHGHVWNPVSKKMAPWIDIKQLHRSQSKGLFFGRKKK